MTVQTINPNNDYVGDGATLVYPFTFQSLEAAWVSGAVDGVQQPGSVDLNPDQSLAPGGTFTFDVAPASGAAVSIIRQSDLLQGTDYAPFTPFPAKDHEEALDKLTMITQQLNYDLSFALKTIPPNGSTNLTFPNPEALQYLRWKADLTGLENIDLSASGAPTTADLVSLNLDGNITDVETWANDAQDEIDAINKSISAGAFIIYDDADQEVKDDLMPISAANNFRSGLAMYHSGMAASYNFVTLKEANDFKKSVNGELLSHSMNSVVLDGAVATSYGENMIRTSATEFSQFGMNPRGFVAPSSTLDSTMFDQLRQSYDYAFIRSVGAGAGTAGINLVGEDRHNMVRVSLEAITEAQAKAYVDLAIENQAFVCFYTHVDVGYLPALMAYIDANFNNITPSEWIGYHYGLSVDTSVKHSKNLLSNSIFKKINSDDTNPYRWVIDTNTLNSPTVTITDKEGGANLDIASNSNLGGESGTVRQNYSLAGLGNLTPFCFSAYLAGLADQNTEIKMAFYLKDATNTTISSAQRTSIIGSNRQRLYVEQAFIPTSSATYLQVEITVTAIDAGTVRAIISSPQLERAGFYTSYEKTDTTGVNYSVIRRTTGLTVSPNTDTLINFNASLEGTNQIFDLTTGEAKPDDDRNWYLSANFGLQAMVDGDSVELHLLIDGTPSRKSLHKCSTGTNIFNAGWTIRGDGRTYAVGIRHDSSAGRAITTFGDATLTVTSD